MESRLTYPNEMEELKARLTSECECIKREISQIHNPVLDHSFNQKSAMYNWAMEMIEYNTNITLPEIEGLIDYRIESLEREIDDAETHEETAKLVDQIRILDRIIVLVRTTMKQSKFTDCSSELQV